MLIGFGTEYAWAENHDDNTSHSLAETTEVKIRLYHPGCISPFISQP
jgi:hypothetical protein